MNIRNTVIEEIIEYSSNKCSLEKKQNKRKKLKCKSNKELYKIYMKKVYKKKKLELFVSFYIKQLEMHMVE